MIAGIILAAGASSRMGRPKALLDFHGETFVDRLIRLMQQSCDSVVVVIGYHADEIRSHVKARVSFVVNPDPDRGQLSSLQAALQILFPTTIDALASPPIAPSPIAPSPIAPSRQGGGSSGGSSGGSIGRTTTNKPSDGFLFIPVDCPAVKPSTVQKVAHAAAQRKPETLFVIPRCGDRRGHPVFATAAIARELLALPPTGQARDVVHKYVAQTRYLDVDDPGILSDIDDPEAYQRLMKEQA